MPATEQEELNRVKAAADLIGRTGAKAFELRYSEPEEDENLQLTAWLAIAQYPDKGWDVGAGVSARHACERLLEQLLDGGGACTHCGKPTTVLHELRDVAVLPGLCAYQYDPSTATYYRACTHDEPPTPKAPNPFRRHGP